MKLNYMYDLEERADSFNFHGEPVNVTRVVHLYRANGKRACKCNLKGSATIKVLNNEYAPLPDDASLCEASAEENEKLLELARRAGVI